MSTRSLRRLQRWKSSIRSADFSPQERTVFQLRLAVFERVREKGGSARMLLLTCLLFIAPHLRAQTPPSPPRPGIIFSPAAAQVAPRPPVAPPGQDAFSALIGSAASIDMEAPVNARVEFEPPSVPLGGRCVYRIVLNALDESVKLPDQIPTPPGLQLQSGGRGQAYQPTGGQKLQPQTTLLFHATPASTGVFTVSSFPITVYGKSVMVPEARLTVTAAGTLGAREPLRLIVEPPEGNIYVGQTIRLRVLLPDPGDGSVQGISQTHVTGESIFSEPISFSRRDTIRRNGQVYPAFVTEAVLTPMRAGQERLVAQGQALSTRVMQGQPGVFQTLNALVDSEPVNLTILPLPKEGQLPGFAGAIGTFQLDPPKLSTNEARAGDPLTLSITLHGDGNIGRLSVPQIPFLRDWQTFPPVGDTAPSYVALQRGFTSFSYTLIPLSDQIKGTPAIPFCYFDPKKAAYVDVTIPPVPVTVKPAPPGGLAKLQSVSTSAAAAEADESGPRERELVLTGLAETPGRSVSTLAPLQQRGWFLALQILPAAGLAGLLGWDKRRRYLAQHPEVLRKRRAKRELRRQLRMARRASAANDAPGFVTGAINALREACAPHSAANPEALVCADVLQELPVPERHGPAGQVIRRLFAAADALHFGGAVKDGSDVLALRPDWEQALNQLKVRL